MRGPYKQVIFGVMLCLAYVAPLLSGQAPELSADEPISFSAESGMLIAAGNAVFVEENTRVEADVIRYQRDRGVIEAEGNVRLTRAGVRLLAEYLTYNTADRSFSARRFRIGAPPAFLEGQSFSGNLDEVAFHDVSFYFHEPVAGSPRLEMGSGRWIRDERIDAEQVSMHPWGGWGLPLPALSYAFGQEFFEIELAGGYRGNLGAYGFGSVLVPIDEQWALGGLVGLYSKRGVLVGPSMRWRSADQRLQLQISGGWIRDEDEDERGIDFLGKSIGRDRGYGMAHLSYRGEGDRLQLQARSTWLSDSEILRDFRPALYGSNYQPDHFAEFNYQHQSLLVSLFARGQLNDAYGMVEKLPELQIEWLPTYVGETGWLLNAYTRATHYRQQLSDPSLWGFTPPSNPLGIPALLEIPGGLPADVRHSRFFTRLEGNLSIARPIAFSHGIDLTLRGGTRLSSYHRQSDAGQSSVSEQRLVGELGVDLSQTLARDFGLSLPRWDVEGIRHVSRLSLQYRWHPGAEEKAGVIPDFERLAYSASAPVINLADIEHVDGLRAWSLLRLGWHHQLLARGKDGQLRDIVALSFTQDIRLDPDVGENTWDAFYWGLEFRPLRWLRVQYQHKIRPEDGRTEATLFRARIQSSDLWYATITTEYLEGAFEQYELAGEYRFAQNWTAIGRWRIDAKQGRFTRQHYGVGHRIGHLWQWEVYASINEDDNRESSFGIGLGIRLLPF